MANLKHLPESLAVIGGGVISVEYATVRPEEAASERTRVTRHKSQVLLSSFSSPPTPRPQAARAHVTTPSSSDLSFSPHATPRHATPHQVFASLGIPTVLLCREEAFLPFLPDELRQAIKADMGRNGIKVRQSAERRAQRVYACLRPRLMMLRRRDRGESVAHRHTRHINECTYTDSPTHPNRPKPHQTRSSTRT